MHPSKPGPKLPTLHPPPPCGLVPQRLNETVRHSGAGLQHSRLELAMSAGPAYMPLRYADRLQCHT